MKFFDRGVAIAGLLDLVPGRGQAQGQPAPQRIVIIGYKNSSHICVL